jgi:predicted AAA+ superfamily ATPase
MIDLAIRRYKTLEKSFAISFRRYLHNHIDWNNRLIGIKGARGVGKTTLLLQRIKYDLKGQNALYLSLDDPSFASLDLVEFADDLSKQGFTHLFLDEVHRFPNWSQSVKTIYDYFPDLHLVFTGSSMIELAKASGDLSRRAAMYQLHGLSLREYINLSEQMDFPAHRLEDILQDDFQLELGKLKPIALFRQYLQYGYYPFFLESSPGIYLQKLKEAINLTLESDIPAVEEISLGTVLKMRKFMGILSASVPFKPNISKLSELLESTRESVVKYLYLLEKAGVVSLLNSSTQGIRALGKPEKILFDNPNIMHAFATSVNVGTQRETFFANQLSKAGHTLTLDKQGDFRVDDHYIFEIGGKSKSWEQIRGLKNSYIAADDIEFRWQNKLPLWYFGFLY